MIDAALKLEAILTAENEALEGHDADAAVALLADKLAAAQALDPEQITPEQGTRLRELSVRNQMLLERALRVQGEIIGMVVRAARLMPAGPRYGAAGNTIPGDCRVALTRQA
ncbi:MAG: hypothetical protein RQ966_09605 [Acetobacteraceae bacterium]|nr:hypothetical protein [Acetobacteraceae bacterium]